MHNPPYHHQANGRSLGQDIALFLEDLLGEEELINLVQNHRTSNDSSPAKLTGASIRGLLLMSYDKSNVPFYEDFIEYRLFSTKEEWITKIDSWLSQYAPSDSHIWTFIGFITNFCRKYIKSIDIQKTSSQLAVYLKLVDHIDNNFNNKKQQDDLVKLLDKKCIYAAMLIYHGIDGMGMYMHIATEPFHQYSYYYSISRSNLYLSDKTRLEHIYNDKMRGIFRLYPALRCILPYIEYAIKDYKFNATDILTALGEIFTSFHEYQQDVREWILPQLLVVIQQRLYTEIMAGKNLAENPDLDDLYRILFIVYHQLIDSTEWGSESHNLINKYLNNNSCDQIEQAPISKIFKNLIDILVLLGCDYEANDYQYSHYTSAATLKCLLVEDSPFRLSSIYLMNDDQEGKILKEILSLDKLKQPTFITPMVACFSYRIDDFNQFRLYAADAVSNTKITGGCIVFNSSFFLRQEDSQTTIQEDSELRIVDPRFLLYRCLYVNPKFDAKNQVISLAGYDEYSYKKLYGSNAEYDEEAAKQKQILDLIRQKFQDLKSMELTCAEGRSKVEGYLWATLTHLVKHADFKDEQECRMINLLPAPESLQDDNRNGNIFINYGLPDLILYIEKVVLGDDFNNKELFVQQVKRKSYDKSGLLFNMGIEDRKGKF